jgi:hypothetical protein
VLAVGTFLLGGLMGGFTTWSRGLPFLLGAVIGAPGVYYMTKGILALGARVFAGSFLAPSGSSTPHRRQYSAAEARIQAGDISGGIAAYEQLVAEDPTDPEPYFRLARLHRDHVGDLPATEQWLRRARRDARLDRGHELLLLQELIDLYLTRMPSPRRAIPELRLLIERFPNTAAAETALGELAALREMLAREHEGGPTVTEQYHDEERGPADQT